jgi:hypothetical protein
MGSSKSKNNKIIQVNDFTKVKIPNGFELIKLATFNINIRNTVNISNKVREIITFITSSFKNKEIDILCLQGILDYNSAYKLVKEVKKYGRKSNNKYYFGPDFEDIDSKSEKLLSIKNKIKTSYKISTRTMKKKLEIQNIIISKYPIVSTIYTELDDKLNLDDIIGTKTLIGANISIYGNIISIYNTTLSKDIKSANINNNDIRDKELQVVFKVIEKNKKNLKTDDFKHYFLTDIHMLAGSLFIKETISLDLNKEFIDFIQKYKCVDIFRIMCEDDIGHTNTSKERVDYIFFLLTNMMYTKNNHKKLKNINGGDDLFKLIFKIYKIYFIDIIIRNDTYTNNSYSNFPLECTFMIYKNNH